MGVSLETPYRYCHVEEDEEENKPEAGEVEQFVSIAFQSDEETDEDDWEKPSVDRFEFSSPPVNPSSPQAIDCHPLPVTQQSPSLARILTQQAGGK